MISRAAARPRAPARRALRDGQWLAGRQHHARWAREVQARLSAGAAACPGRPPPHSLAVDTGRSASPAVRAASQALGCGPGLSSYDGAARRAQAPQRRAPRPRPSEHARFLPPTRTAAARPPRAHGRGLPGPLAPRVRARLLGAESLPVPAVGPCRRCPLRPAAAANGSRTPHTLPGRGGRASAPAARGRRVGEGPRAGWGRAHDAIGGSVDQWQRRTPANKETTWPMETGGGDKEQPGVR